MTKQAILHALKTAHKLVESGEITSMSITVITKNGKPGNYSMVGSSEDYPLLIGELEIQKIGLVDSLKDAFK